MIHQYKLNGYNIVLDVYSGSVHLADDVAYDCIALFESTPRDQIIAQMMEPVEMPEMVDYKFDPEKKPWACTGWNPGDAQAKRGVINSIYLDPAPLSVHNDELQACYREITANEQQWEEYNLEGAEYVITAFGTVARIAKSAIVELKEQGINVGLVRPITVWTFPYDAVKQTAKQPGENAVLNLEQNEGQMLEDLNLANICA